MMRVIYSLAFSLGFTDWKLKETPVEIFETVKGMKKGHALDLGCGEGEHAVALAKKGWQVVEWILCGQPLKARKSPPKNREWPIKQISWLGMSPGWKN